MLDIDPVKFDLEKLAQADKDPNDPGTIARSYASVAIIADDPIRIFMGNPKGYSEDELFNVAYGVGLLYHAVMKNVINSEALNAELVRSANEYITQGARKYVMDPIPNATPEETEAAVRDVVTTKMEWLLSAMILRIAVSRLTVTEKLCGDAVRTVRYE